MKTFPLSEKLVVDISNYLATRPWAEVNAMIFEIQKQVKEAVEAAAPKPEE